MSDEIVRGPFSGLRQFTGARIALGRTGDSLPTTDLLDFSVAHALARDAVHAELDVVGLTRQLQACGIDPLRVHSAAADRGIYLRRPDLGRKLDQVSREMLLANRPAVTPKSVFVIADGLSALAPSRYALPVIEALREQAGDVLPGPVVLAEQARVALGDEIGEALGAEIAVVLIGERPGLSAPDSLGIYFTYAPRVGRTDAERNCISNVRLEGLSPERAARTLLYLWSESHRLQRSGVDLKDRSEEQESLLPPHESSPLRKQIKSTGFLTGG